MYGMDDTPDPREVAELEAEMEARRKRLAREWDNSTTPAQKAAHWDQQNRLSIARGDGELPF